MAASQVAHRREPALYQRLTRLFLLLIAVGSVVAIIVPAGIGWDFANFYDTGRRVSSGQLRDIYDATTPIAGRAPQGVMRFWGTPISAFFYVPLGWFSAGTALVLFKIENVLALASGVLVLFLFYRRFVPDSPVARQAFAATVTLLCLIYQPFWTAFRVGGQTTASVFLLLALGLVTHTQGRLWTSAICVALAALVKPALAPMLIFLMLVSGWAFLWRLASMFAIVGAASLIGLGWPIHAEFLKLASGGVQGTFPWYLNSSLDVIVENVRVALAARGAPQSGDWIVTALSFALRIAILGTMAFLLIKSRRRAWTAAARRHFHFLLAIVFFLLWSRTLWDHYLAMLFVPLIYILAAREYFDRAALWLVAAIAVLSLGQNIVLIEFLHRHLVLESLVSLLAIALFKTGPLVLTMVLLWRHWRGLLDSHSAPAWPRDPVADAGAV